MPGKIEKSRAIGSVVVRTFSASPQTNYSPDWPACVVDNRTDAVNLGSPKRYAGEPIIFSYGDFFSDAFSACV
jgi:hypothetical protein